MFDDFCDIVLGELLAGDDLLEEFASLAELDDEDVVGLVVVDFEEPDDVDMVEGFHDGHFDEELLMFLLAQGRFFYLFGSAKETGVFGLDLVDFSEAASSDFLDDEIIIEIVTLLHLDKAIPLDSYILVFFLCRIWLGILDLCVLFLVDSLGDLGVYPFVFRLDFFAVVDFYGIYVFEGGLAAWF